MNLVRGLAVLATFLTAIVERGLKPALVGAQRVARTYRACFGTVRDL